MMMFAMDNIPKWAMETKAFRSPQLFFCFVSYTKLDS